MLVVSNTSPLSNLAIIGRLELVREQLGMVVIPPAVQVELSLNPNNRIPSLKAESERLRNEARFFISPALEKGLLTSAGE